MEVGAEMIVTELQTSAGWSQVVVIMASLDAVVF
jgi:hypothetical protein